MSEPFGTRYIVRSVHVMLDFELAEFYGYETKNFNRQVKNNSAKFEGDDFMFQLTRDEIDNLSRCKNFTTIQTKGIKGCSPYLPYAFTEQGIYMLMTVLRGDLAIRQSRALVMAFNAIKDYIVKIQGLVSQRDILRISIQTAENTEAIRNVQAFLIDQRRWLLEHYDKLAGIGQYRNLSTPIGKLMHDFYCTKAEDILYPVLREENVLS